MDNWFKDILPDKDPFHNRGRDQMRKKRGPEFECLWYKRALYRFNPKENVVTSASVKFCVRPLEISGIQGFCGFVNEYLKAKI